MPLGTKVDVVAASNGNLSKVYAIDQNSGELTHAEITPAGFTLPIEKIDGNRDIAFYMVDQHGVVSETPHRITLDSVEDQPPAVEGLLTGIGSAITPNAVIPLVGTITDDYDVNSVWIEIETPVSDTILQDVPQKTIRVSRCLIKTPKYWSSLKLPTKWTLALPPMWGLVTSIP